jgi:hypothetical protein
MPLEPKDPDLTVSYMGGDLDPLRQSIALFRYGVIADLTHLPPQHRGLYMRC